MQSRYGECLWPFPIVIYCICTVIIVGEKFIIQQHVPMRWLLCNFSSFVLTLGSQNSGRAKGFFPATRFSNNLWWKMKYIKVNFKWVSRTSCTSLRTKKHYLYINSQFCYSIFADIRICLRRLLCKTFLSTLCFVNVFLVYLRLALWPFWPYRCWLLTLVITC